MESNIQSAKLYTDLNGLNKLKNAAADNNSGAIQEVAGQFTALFFQMLLTSMREANESFKSELSSGSEQGFYEEMHDKQMAIELAGASSNNLTELLVRQLEGNKGELNTNLNNTINQNLSSVSNNIIEKSEQFFENPQDFISKLLPKAKSIANKLGLEPALLIAQAALETGWGKSINGNNLFNIKADKSWNDDKINIKTIEYKNGLAEKTNADFRKYNSLEESFEDFVKFINENPRYSTAIKNIENPEKFITELHKAGYATDPKYAQKVISIFNKIQANIGASL